MKIPNNCRQLVVLCPGIAQLKSSGRRQVYFLMKKVQSFHLEKSVGTGFWSGICYLLNLATKRLVKSC